MIRGGNVAKGTRGGRGRTIISSAKDGLQLGNDNIEFDGVLGYTKNDSSINQVQRAFLDTWEAKRENAKVEYANAVGYQGSEYGEIRGGKNGAKLPAFYTANKGSVVTHIHPRGEGKLGGTFSDADIKTWSRGNGQTIRAVAKEGTYSISKGKNFDGAGIYKFVTSQYNKYNKQMAQAHSRYQGAVNNGTMSVKVAQSKLDKAFNNVLVSMHNDFINNQSVYGYNYYLEKR